MLTIKNASVTDIPLIRELTFQVWPQTYTPIVGETQVAYMLERFYAADALKEQMETLGHHFIICLKDGQPAGFASWATAEPKVCKLHKLYVLPAMQGYGIGRHMITAILSAAASAGASSLKLNVNRYNTGAITFYEKAGFLLLKDEDIDIGNNYFMNDHVFEKTL